jgi:hypothetical protein
MVAVIISANTPGRKSGRLAPAISPYMLRLFVMPPVVAGSRMSTPGTTSVERQGKEGEKESGTQAGEQAGRWVSLRRTFVLKGSGSVGG